MLFEAAVLCWCTALCCIMPCLDLLTCCAVPFCAALQAYDCEIGKRTVRYDKVHGGQREVINLVTTSRMWELLQNKPRAAALAAAAAIHKDAQQQSADAGAAAAEQPRHSRKAAAAAARKTAARVRVIAFKVKPKARAAVLAATATAGATAAKRAKQQGLSASAAGLAGRPTAARS
jgi:hypothetical protein